MSTIYYNAHHAPIGAFATFTLGELGATGGLGLELGRPANQSIYIGVESEADTFDFLPFYRGAEGKENSAAAAERARYEAGGAQPQQPAPGVTKMRSYALDKIARDLHAATDSWSAGDLKFEVFSPILPVPDPDSGDDAALRLALLPAVLAELTIDNSRGTTARRAVFGFETDDVLTPPAIRRLDDTLEAGYQGVGQGHTIAIVAHDPDIASAQGFTLTDILNERIPENLTFALGSAAALIGAVPAGAIKTFRFVLSFYRGGIATAGLDTTYLYTRFWPNIEAVSEYALGHFDELRALATEANGIIDGSALSDDQKFMLSHAVRSYYGSTQLLQDTSGHPVWIVNEGEYRMMNTLDLTADQLFYELEMNPWTVRNELDFFAERYSYTDEVYAPGQPDKLFPGGISFTHDMGVANVFSRPHYSSYEKYGLHGCFSHMTHEELINWLCCALVYGRRDPAWLTSKLPLLERCFESVLHRDNPDPTKRNGLMGFDSSRCHGGSEITTYDSLDTSLGQSRGNVYLAGKCWAAYLGLQRVFLDHNLSNLADRAYQQAMRVEKTVIAAVGEDGSIPAVIGEDVPARIIPAIEGLIFPDHMGCPDVFEAGNDHGDYIWVMRRHLEKILAPGTCLFPDGGWKLSSTSDNSWLSKIYLCQHIARHLLGVDGDHVTANADAAHVRWLLDPVNSYWAWSDQMSAGVAVGSKYYPRGVTAWLWLSEASGPPNSQ